MIYNKYANELGSINCSLIPACFECPYADISTFSTNAYSDGKALYVVEIKCSHAPVCDTMHRVDQPDISELVKNYLAEKQNSQ